MHNRQPERSGRLAVLRAGPPRRGAIALGLGCLGVCLLSGTTGARAQQAELQVTSRPLSGTDAGTILGRSVFDLAGADVGQLVDVLVDKAGDPLAAVIDVGGFLGVGTRRIAVAWRLLRFVHDTDGTHIVIDLTLDSAAAAPEFQGPDNTLIVIDRPPS